MNKSKQWISKLNLKPHPEGGYYSEVYRSDEIISSASLNKRYSGSRSISTSIYFLLNGNQFSAFHKIKSDELWHFYDGSAINIYIVSENGVLEIVKLGIGIEENETPQVVIPKNVWFAAQPIDSSGYTLVGCTVAPGFDFIDFELGKRQTLIQKYPQHEKIISKFTSI
ncbi:MAG: cupin domain-containing protein [Melioribacteraceae bacterium]|jgi:predicted cupin superfamily sugar epimerase|nr:cupin domain-containing protein [Melioribacteraceae bacterium]